MKKTVIKKSRKFNVKSLKTLGLDTADWLDRSFEKNLEANIVNAIENVIRNMAKQVSVVANRNGDITLLLPPIDAGDKKDKFIAIEFYDNNFQVTFNIMDVLRRYAYQGEYSDLLLLSDKIRQLAERLANKEKGPK